MIILKAKQVLESKEYKDFYLNSNMIILKGKSIQYPKFPFSFI